MFMSLNSLDSKISPHSLHSTNSESSSRLTTCTRGCLHGCFMSRLWGEVDFEVINPEGLQTNHGGGDVCAGIHGILDPVCRLSSPLKAHPREFVTKFVTMMTSVTGPLLIGRLKSRL